MDSIKFYLNADELRENRLRRVYRNIEEIIINRNLEGNKHVWLPQNAFADFTMGIFEEKLKECGFIVSYTNKSVRDVMGKAHGTELCMVIEWS